MEEIGEASVFSRSQDRISQQLRGGRLSSLEPTRLLVLCDPGQDLDDELALTLLAVLRKWMLVEVLGVVATLGPAAARASLARGTLDELGMHDVPVGVGSDGGGTGTSELCAEVPYMGGAVQLDGQELMTSALRAAPDASVTFLVIASHRDLARLMESREELFRAKISSVVSMGGVCPVTSAGERLRPDTAHNNLFDLASTEYAFAACQRWRIPLVVVSRFAAYQCQMPRSLYDRMAASGARIGKHLQRVQRLSIEKLWQRACAPEGAPERQGLPARCDRAWFLATFCSRAAGEGASARGVQGARKGEDARAREGEGGSTREGARAAICHG